MFLISIPPTTSETDEIALWTLVLTMIFWILRIWWQWRHEVKNARRVERRLENEWTNGDDTLSGSRNPGRTTAQLVELVHEDLQHHKRETSRKFDRLIEDVGRIKGKLDIN